MARRERRQGYYMVKWSIVMLNKGRGGLGIRNLKVQNRSSLMKWRWISVRIRHSGKEVITIKYGELSPRCTE